MENSECIHQNPRILVNEGRKTDVVVESRGTITKVNNSHTKSLHASPKLSTSVMTQPHQDKVTSLPTKKILTANVIIKRPENTE